MKKQIVKIELKTTLNRLRKFNACESGMNTLVASLPKGFKNNKSINLLYILESNGIEHFFWAWRATTKKGSQVKRNILADIVEEVEPIFAKKYPNNLSVKNVIKYLRKGTMKQLIEAKYDADAAAVAYAAAAAAAYADATAAAYADATAVAYAAAIAYAAAYAAADAVAYDAAYAAAYDAAYAAADAAAYDAAYDAAYAAARQKMQNKQIEIIKKYLK